MLQNPQGNRGRQGGLALLDALELGGHHGPGLGLQDVAGGPGTQGRKHMGIIVMDRGHDHDGVRSGRHQLADQALAGAVGQAPVHQGQAVVVGPHQRACLGQIDGHVDPLDARQGPWQQLRKPLPRLIQVFNNQGAGKRHGASK